MYGRGRINGILLYNTSWNVSNLPLGPKYELEEWTAQKMKFYIMVFLSKFDQIGSFLRIWSHLLKKYLMENFIFCAVVNESFKILKYISKMQIP